jgi:hypothetical protein
MTKIRGVTGGGINSNKVTQVNAPKREPTVNQIDPNRPSQIGLSVHYIKAPLYQSTTASTPYGATPGNDCRPGGNGRMVMKAGSQSKTPAPTPMGRGRSLFK